MEIHSEFLDFLQEYDIVSLAIALVIGLAVKDLVSATVDDLIMPIVQVFLPGGNWEQTVTQIGPFTFRTGHFLSVALEFVIIAFLIFAFVKYVMNKEKVGKI